MDEVIIGSPLTDIEAMNLAIQEAQKGLGWVSPNPAVGCVILDNKNCLLSKGYHKRYGGPHAEINALNGLSRDSLTGARVFVTLEPCAHHGKTPPCAEALAGLPLQEVLFGIIDPNPLVQGKGADYIRSAGIKVTHFNHDPEALEKSCEHFLKNIRAKEPFVSLKIASSLDGKIALHNGLSQWITGEPARQTAHFLRATHDAILIGVSTFLIDDPSLSIRHPDFPDKPYRVLVLDPKGRGLEKLANSKLLNSHSPQQITWITGETTSTKVLSEIGIQSLQIPYCDGADSLDLKILTKELWKIGVRSLLVEGGGVTLSAFIEQKIADRLYLFIAPLIIGEKNGIGWSSNISAISKLTESISLSALNSYQEGKDLLLTARFLS